MDETEAAEQQPEQKLSMSDLRAAADARQAEAAMEREQGNDGQQQEREGNER